MPSKLEAMLLPPNQAISSTLLQHLDHESLLRLRRCSRSCRDAVATRSAQLFQNLYMHAPLIGNSALREVDVVGPNCRHLTIKVKLPDTSRSVSKAIAPIKNETHSLLKNALERNRQSRATSASSTDALPDPGSLAMDQTLWAHAFAWCGRVNKITLRIDGDPVWPGRTRIEEMLVTLRMSLENSRMPQLRVLELQPTHAMGIIHLRWDTFGAWRAVQPLGAQIWRNLTTLKLTLHNPSNASRSPETRRIIPSQYLMFLKMLQAYLRSFSPTLQCLKFMWLGCTGPSPILLHREQGMEGQKPIEWIRLEELWYGNITHQRGTLLALPQLAPSLTKIKALRHAGTFAATSELEAWQHISVPNASTSYVPGDSNDFPVPKDILDCIEAANVAHAQNTVTSTASAYDHPLSALLNKLSRRPIPRKRFQNIQHASPPPTRPLPVIPNEAAIIAAQTAPAHDGSHAVTPSSTVPRASDSAPVPESGSAQTALIQNDPQAVHPSASLTSTSETEPQPDPASTASEVPELPKAAAPPLPTTAHQPETLSAAAARVANWRHAMALSTISFADTNGIDRNTSFSETNTDADDLLEDIGRPRPDSMAWPVTRFQPHRKDEGRAPQPSGQSGMWFANDSLESLASAVLRDAWENERGSEYSDDEADENGDRMSTGSARVAPLRLGARKTETGTEAATTSPATMTEVQPPRGRADTTSSNYSEAGAYGGGTYRPPARRSNTS